MHSVTGQVFLWAAGLGLLSAVGFFAGSFGRFSRVPSPSASRKLFRLVSLFALGDALLCGAIGAALRWDWFANAPWLLLAYLGATAFGAGLLLRFFWRSFQRLQPQLRASRPQTQNGDAA